MDDFQRSNKNTGTGFVCSQSSCDFQVSASEVSHRLQEIRVNLEKAVDLMEGERPGEKKWQFDLNLFQPFAQQVFLTYLCYSSSPASHR